MMPIAGAMAINFSAPLFATLFAAFWLKEYVGPRARPRWPSAFSACCWWPRPAPTVSASALCSRIANAVLYGSVTAAVRGMSRTESAETLTIYQMGFMTLFFLIAQPRLRLHRADRQPTPPRLIVGRRPQRRRPILVDAGAVAGAACGSRSVLLFLAGLGDDPWLRVLGRRADAVLAGGLRDRRRLRPVPALARERQEAARKTSIRTSRKG